jgi:transposase
MKKRHPWLGMAEREEEESKVDPTCIHVFIL